MYLNKRDELYTLRWYAKKQLTQFEKLGDKRGIKLAKEQIMKLSELLGESKKDEIEKAIPKKGGKYRLGIIVGHTRRSSGARAVALKTSEYVYNSAFAELLQKKGKDFGIDVFVEHRDSGGISGAYSRIKKHKPQALIELHFNSHNSNASGCEVLYSDRYDQAGLKEIEFAGMINTAMNNVLGNKNRGLKNRATKGERGFWNLMQTKTLCSVLTEPFFGSSRQDTLNFDKKKDKVASAMLRAFIAWANKNA